MLMGGSRKKKRGSIGLGDVYKSRGRRGEERGESVNDTPNAFPNEGERGKKFLPEGMEYWGGRGSQDSRPFPRLGQEARKRGKYCSFF